MQARYGRGPFGFACRWLLTLRTAVAVVVLTVLLAVAVLAAAELWRGWDVVADGTPARSLPGAEPSEFSVAYLVAAGPTIGAYGLATFLVAKLRAVGWRRRLAVHDERGDPPPLALAVFRAVLVGAVVAAVAAWLTWHFGLVPPAYVLPLTVAATFGVSVLGLSPVGWTQRRSGGAGHA